MLMITITIAALATLSVITFNYLANKKKATDLLIKYNTVKEYADNAAKHILKLEEDNSNLSAFVIKLKSQCQSVNDLLTAEKRKNLDVVNKETTVSTTKTENGTRRGRPNKA